MLIWEGAQGSRSEQKARERRRKSQSKGVILRLLLLSTGLIYSAIPGPLRTLWNTSQNHLPERWRGWSLYAQAPHSPWMESSPRGVHHLKEKVPPYVRGNLGQNDLWSHKLREDPGTAGEAVPTRTVCTVATQVRGACEDVTGAQAEDGVLATASGVPALQRCHHSGWARGGLATSMVWARLFHNMSVRGRPRLTGLTFWVPDTCCIFSGAWRQRPLTPYKMSRYN